MKNKKTSELAYYDQNSTYSRSNFLISSKYRSSLLSNRLMAVALSRLSTAEESDEGYLTVKIKGKQIQELLGTKGNGFFDQLSHTAEEMTGKTLGWSDPESQKFTYISVITKAEYHDGTLAVQFHKDLRNYLVDLKSSYTQFSLPVILSLKSTSSFRLYELLKSRCYYRKGEERADNLFKIEYDINELRLCLGVVNAEIDSVRRVLNRQKSSPEMFAKACAASPEHMYESWGDFNRYILQKAMKEINSKPETGLYIHEIVPQKAGKGGKVYAVAFYVEKFKNDKNKPIEPVLNEVDEMDLIDEIRDMISGIKSKEAKLIGQAANWNMVLIREKYEISENQNVDNIVAWMIDAIKNNYEKPVKKSRKIEPGFKQRKYDYDKLLNEVMQ